MVVAVLGISSILQLQHHPIEYEEFWSYSVRVQKSLDRLKKIFEDGVVKREENLQAILEVETARHAYWRREKRKKQVRLTRLDRLKKIFEDGVVKREENLQAILEVETARHEYRGNWRRGERKKQVVPAGIAGFEDVEIEGIKETVGDHLFEVAVGIDHLSAID
nr:hypothetical protein [Tanacetum cinerariifolium]